jgi:hypothetical protein
LAWIAKYGKYGRISGGSGWEEGDLADSSGMLLFLSPPLSQVKKRGFLAEVGWDSNQTFPGVMASKLRTETRSMLICPETWPVRIGRAV